MHSCPRVPPPAAAPPLPRPTEPCHDARPGRLQACFALEAGAGSVRRMQWPTAPGCTAGLNATLHAVGNLLKGAASTRRLGGCESAFRRRVGEKSSSLGRGGEKDSGLLGFQVPWRAHRRIGRTLIKALGAPWWPPPPHTPLPTFRHCLRPAHPPTRPPRHPPAPRPRGNLPGRALSRCPSPAAARPRGTPGARGAPRACSSCTRRLPRPPCPP